MTWPTGREAIAQLLAEGRLQQVSASTEDAAALLEAARRHLTSARALAETDPGGAYSLLHDAARKSLVALLQAQGLRATTRGGHWVVEQAVRAQFTSPQLRMAFRPFGRLRQARHRVEHEPISHLQPDDVITDTASAERLHHAARDLVEDLDVWEA